MGAKPKQLSSLQQDPSDQTPSRNVGGRPPGSYVPVIVRGRISYFVDAQLAVICEMTGERRSDIVRLALNHYMATYADYDHEMLRHVLGRIASVLRSNGDKESLRYLANDASRFYGITSMEACKILGISVDVLAKDIVINVPAPLAPKPDSGKKQKRGKK